MKPPRFEYERARSVDEALRLLADGDAQPLAGGQSLVPAMNFRLAMPARLVDLNAISELRHIELQANGDIVAGAMARHRDFETSALMRERLPLLPWAMEGVAHVAIRNRGTIGGSLAHADPAADWPALCMACDAVMTLSSSQGKREVPARQFSLGIFETALQPGEIVTAVRFPRWPTGRRWGVQKMTRRRGDFAIVGVALTLDVDNAGHIVDARIALQGVAGCPVMAEDSRALLLGRRPDVALVSEAARAARRAATPDADRHASAEFRGTLMETLTRRALAQALDLPEAMHV